MKTQITKILFKTGRRTRDRLQAKDRKRKERALKKQREIGEGIRDVTTGKKIGKALEPANVATSSTEVATLSRIGHSGDWKLSRNGTRGGSIQKPHVRTNWYHPLLWRRIDAAAWRVQFSPSAIVQYLQREDPILFKRLWPGTVCHWIEGQQWNAATIRNAERGKAPVQRGRSAILEPYVASSSVTLQHCRLSEGENPPEDWSHGNINDRSDEDSTSDYDLEHDPSESEVDTMRIEIDRNNADGITVAQTMSISHVMSL